MLGSQDALLISLMDGLNREPETPQMFQTAFQFVDLLSLSDLEYQKRVAVIRDIFTTGRFDPDRINGAPGNPVELKKLGDLYLQLQTMGLARLRCRFDEDEIESKSNAYAMMY